MYRIVRDTRKASDSPGSLPSVKTVWIVLSQLWRSRFNSPGPRCGPCPSGLCLNQLARPAGARKRASSDVNPRKDSPAQLGFGKHPGSVLLWFASPFASQRCPWGWLFALPALPCVCFRKGTGPWEAQQQNRATALPKTSGWPGCAVSPRGGFCSGRFEALCFPRGQRGWGQGLVSPGP